LLPVTLVATALSTLTPFSYLFILHPPSRTEFRISRLPALIPGTANHTMSACLLLNDDNHFLVEWLAFHWQTMPLRRLIVATDPRSRTSPSKILERWKPFMNISEWKDDDYFPLWFRTSVIRSKNRKSISDKLMQLHRTRQRHFYVGCMRQLKREHDEQSNISNKEPHWAAFIDVDEFLFLNRNWEYHSLLPPNRDGSGPTDTIVSILHRLANFAGFRGACIGLPRLLIGAKESAGSISNIPHKQATLLEAAWGAVFPSVDNQSLLTWEWNWHENLYSPSVNKAGKALLDLSRVPAKMVAYAKADVHRPIEGLCTEDSMWTPNVESPIVLHHYIGTFDQFTYRSDSRKGRRTADEYLGYQNVSFATVLPWECRRWLVDFVSAMGAGDAARLLEGAGHIDQDAPPALAEEEFLKILQDSTVSSTAKTNISWISQKQGHSKH
jgi:hypothetical protein